MRFASTLEQQQQKAQEYLEKHGKGGKSAFDTMQNMVYKDAKVGAGMNSRSSVSIRSNS